MNIKHFELVSVANEFLNVNYSMSLTIPIEFNARLKRVLGRFIYFNGKSKKIELSTDFLRNQPKEYILDVLKHELVHYALYELGKPYKDGEYYFENELKRLGIKPSGAYQYAGDVHKYICELCGKEYERKRRVPATARCSCSLWNGKLKYIGIHKKSYNEVATKSAD